MAYDDAQTNGNLGYLNAGRPTSRRVSAGPPKGRKPSSSFMQTPDDEDGAHGMHSLAHELAVALMPEPSAGQRLLQEELGIEYDEGAEGIDEPPDTPSVQTTSFADELDGAVEEDLALQPHEAEITMNDDLAAHFGSHANGMVQEESEPMQRQQQPARDPMDILSRDLESTDRFIAQLKQLDSESASSSLQPSIEKLASDVIRHFNESVRDREGQVRELLVLEREFKKIATEVNGYDVLGQLDTLEGLEGLSDKPAAAEGSRPEGRLQAVLEETRAHQRSYSNDWETNPDDNMLGDEDEYGETPESPLTTKDSFTAPPSINGPPTVPNILPHVAHVRSLTSSLASSLTAISEHAQVNGAANTDAGRKIRALKNKLGGWRSEQESAEKSRIKIERWEAGITDDETPMPSTPPARPMKRIDARRIIEEHLRAFEAVLTDAGLKTQAIMARS